MIEIIVWVIVGILVLSFFGISLPSIINSPVGQANIQYLWDLVVLGWNWIIELIMSFWNLLPF